MGLGTQDDFQGQHFTRSNNNFGPLSTAVLIGHNGTSTSINLGAGGTYTYLFAKYDGPNYGSEVWYVGDLCWDHHYSRHSWRLWPFRLDALYSWRSRRSGRWHHSHVARCSAQCARHGPTLHKELTGYGPDSGAKTDLTGQGKTCPVFFCIRPREGLAGINVKRHGSSRNTRP